MQFKFDELRASDAQLLGRVTYTEFAAAWPNMTEAGEFAEMMNTMPKYSVSSTLTDATWDNSTIIADNVVGEVTKLKVNYSGDLLVCGSATLVGTLRRHDLVDEYRLIVHPVVLGTGKRLFADATAPTDLTLVDHRKVGPDVLLLTYHPTRADRGSTGWPRPRRRRRAGRGRSARPAQSSSRSRTIATPSSSLDAVTSSAIARTVGCALATATPRPAHLIIGMSLGMSPIATTWSARTSH
jgi:dihydrofolate reductase